MSFADGAPYVAALVSLVVGWLGYVRAQRSDQVTSYKDLLADYRKEVDRIREEHDRDLDAYESKLDGLQAEIATLRDEISGKQTAWRDEEVRLRDIISRQTERIDHLETVLRREGITE